LDQVCRILTAPCLISKEIKLFTKGNERERIENQADLYAIVTLLEHLERAYIRDAITATECVALFSVG
jgi:ESCRT-I complex subunit VPS28